VSQKKNDTSKLQFDHAVRTDVGKKRNENQDAYGYLLGKRGNLFIVADGMGGAQGGATASAIAVEVVSRLAADKDAFVTEESLRRAIESANSTIFEVSRKDESLSGMGTTIVALALRDNKALVAHVGDSRIYRLRDGQLTQLTRDHTLVQELIDSGAILPEQAENHPIAHMLTRSLGPSGAVEVEIREHPEEVKSGDIFLLCCDGLFNMIEEDEIAKILTESEPKAAVEKLVERANEEGGTDNITVEVVRAEPAEAGSAETHTGEVEMARSEPPEELDLEDIPIKDTGKDAPREEIPKAEDQIHATSREQVTSSSSAIDSLLFGKHGEMLIEPPETRYENLFKPETDLEVDSSELEERTELLSSHTRDMQQLDRLGYIALGAIVLTALVVVVEFYDSNTTVPITIAPPVQLAAQFEPEEKPSELPLAPLVGEVQEKNPDEVDWAREEVPLDVVRANIQADSIDAVEPVPEELSESGQAIAKLVADASLLAVPPPPPLTVRGEQPSEPIIWEHESHRIEQIERSVDNSATPDDASDPLVLSEDETVEFSERKADIRDSIALIDARLRQLGLKDELDVQEKSKEISEQLKLIETALSYVTSNYETAKRRYEVWEERATLLAKGEELSLAAQVSLSSVPVRRKKEAYEIASVRYLDAVELWREDPSQDETASRMAKLGRELESRRLELEQAVRAAVERAQGQAKFDVSEFALVKEDLERRRNRLNRQLGFLAARTDISDEKRLADQSKLLKERTELLEELRRLQLVVSDEQELTTRRAQALRELGLETS